MFPAALFPPSLFPSACFARMVSVRVPLVVEDVLRAILLRLDRLEQQTR
jgi:hypothetical protein